MCCIFLCCIVHVVFFAFYFLLLYILPQQWANIINVEYWYHTGNYRKMRAKKEEVEKNYHKQMNRGEIGFDPEFTWYKRKIEHRIEISWSTCQVIQTNFVGTFPSTEFRASSFSSLSCYIFKWENSFRVACLRIFLSMFLCKSRTWYFFSFWAIFGYAIWWYIDRILWRILWLGFGWKVSMFVFVVYSMYTCKTGPFVINPWWLCFYCCRVHVHM